MTTSLQLSATAFAVKKVSATATSTFERNVFMPNAGSQTTPPRWSDASFSSHCLLMRNEKNVASHSSTSFRVEIGMPIACEPDLGFVSSTRFQFPKKMRRCEVRRKLQMNVDYPHGSIPRLQLHGAKTRTRRYAMLQRSAICRWTLHLARGQRINPTARRKFKISDTEQLSATRKNSFLPWRSPCLGSFLFIVQRISEEKNDYITTFGCHLPNGGRFGPFALIACSANQRSDFLRRRLQAGRWRRRRRY